MSKPPKKKLLMVGDSLNADMRGAKRFCIPVCWYNPHGASLPPDLHLDHEIHALGELV